MKHLLLSSLFFLAACGPNGKIIVDVDTPELHQDRPNFNLQDEQVIQFVNEFYAQAKSRNVSTTDKFTSISFVDSYEAGTDAVGRCNTWEYSDGRLYKREMTILTSYWRDASDTSKRSLVYHELGHCALGLDHTPEGLKQIMNPYILNDIYAEENWEFLLNFFFSPTTTQDKLSLTGETCEYGEHHGI